MQGDQKFEIGDNATKVAEIGLFAKFVLPYIVHILLGAIFILAAVLLTPFLITFFPSIDITQIGAGVVSIVLLILVLSTK